DVHALSDRPGPVVLGDLRALASNERANTAMLLARLAEVDVRKLYVPAAYSCLLDYCMGELGFTKQAALKRIRVARAARELPAIYPAIADGRLSIPALEQLLAERFPRTTMPLWCPPELAEHTETSQLVSAQIPEVRVPRAKLTPISATQAALQVVIAKETREKLEYAQALLAHQVRGGAVAEVLDRALDAL